MTQATPHGPEGKPPFWRDLNVFVAAFAAIAFVAGFAVFVPLSIVLKLVLPAREAELIALPLGYILVAAGLAWRWRTHGLSPRHRVPARERRFQVGHVLLAVFNVTMVAMFLGTWLGAHSLLPRLPAAAGIVVALMSLAPIGVFAGLVMVWSARGTPPAFPDTVPAALGEQGQAPPANWQPEPTPAERAPSIAGVLVGVVVSSLMLFMAGVFGAIAFTNKQDVFFNIVIPIAVGVYVLYLITVFRLFYNGRGAANWVAWAPVIVVFAMSTVGPMIGMLIGMARAVV